MTWNWVTHVKDRPAFVTVLSAVKYKPYHNNALIITRLLTLSGCYNCSIRDLNVYKVYLWFNDIIAQLHFRKQMSCPCHDHETPNIQVTRVNTRGFMHHWETSNGLRIHAVCPCHCQYLWFYLQLIDLQQSMHTLS